MDQTDIIDLYLKGLLQGEELDKFLLELKGNEAFAEHVEIRKQIIESIQELRHEELKNYIARHTKENVLIRLPGPKWAYGVAASLLLLASAFFIFQDQLPQNVNPIAIFQPKDKVNDDTLLIGSKEEQYNVTVENEPLGQEIPIEEELIDTNAIAFDDEMDVNNLEEKDIEVQQDKIVKTQSAFTIEHATRYLKDTMEERAVNAAPASTKTESESVIDKKVKSTEVKSPSTTSDDQTHSELKKDKNQKIQIEFWQSIVSYKGYKWNGKTLRLYGIDSTSNVELHHLDKNYYLQINKEYFLLRLTDNYESYIKITDAALIERLKK